MTKKKTFSPEFRLEAAQLVVDQGYTKQAACDAMIHFRVMAIGHQGVLATVGSWCGQIRAARTVAASATAPSRTKVPANPGYAPIQPASG